jgi:nitrogen fixation NifU-like protein
MSELKDLYQQVILDHNKNPRNFRNLEKANRTAEGYNPVCGDQLVIYVDYENELIRDIGFQGSGCAISKASASLMTENVKCKN